MSRRRWWRRWPLRLRDPDQGGRGEQLAAAVSTAAEVLEDAKIKGREARVTAIEAMSLARKVDRLTAEVDRALRMRGAT